MDISSSKIQNLRKDVDAVTEEFDMAVGFHEAWKPAAFDVGLHQRMGTSYATTTFLIVRVALRREVLLAMMRLWDRSGKAVHFESIARALRNKEIVEVLAEVRAAKLRAEARIQTEWNSAECSAQTLEHLSIKLKELIFQKAKYAIDIIDKYPDNVDNVRSRLKKLRDECLAHRQKPAATTAIADAIDSDIEDLYKDSLTLIQILNHLFGVAYNPQDTAAVYRDCAKSFWARTHGEHP